MNYQCPVCLQRERDGFFQYEREIKHEPWCTEQMRRDQAVAERARDYFAAQWVGSEAEAIKAVLKEIVLGVNVRVYHQ